jgi:toxin ParE1/3/4
MKLVFTEAALEDLRAIRAYTLEHWAAPQEQRYLDSLWEKFEAIAADPARYRLRHDLFPGCRTAAQGKHVILFRIGQDSLEIVRVLHAAMDFKRHLPTDPEN